MGKIFQPEVAARAVYFAATHRRREVWVGWPAVQAIVGTKFIPGLARPDAGRTAVDGQQTDEPLPPGRRDNLWEPVPGDHGAHGRFDPQAHGGQLAVLADDASQRAGACGLGRGCGGGAAVRAPALESDLLLALLAARHQSVPPLLGRGDHRLHRLRVAVRDAPWHTPSPAWAPRAAAAAARWDR